MSERGQQDFDRRQQLASRLSEAQNLLKSAIAIDENTDSTDSSLTVSAQGFTLKPKIPITEEGSGSVPADDTDEYLEEFEYLGEGDVITIIRRSYHSFLKNAPSYELIVHFDDGSITIEDRTHIVRGVRREVVTNILPSPELNAEGIISHVQDLLNRLIPNQ